MTKAIAAVMIMLFLASMLIANSAATSVLFADDFEDGAAEGWTVVNPRPDEDPSIYWAVEWDHDTFVYSGEGGGIWGGGDAIAYAGDFSWTDYSIQAGVKIVEARNPGSHHGIIGRFQDATNFYEFGVWGRWSDGAHGEPRIMLLRGWHTPSEIIASKTEEEMGTLGIPVPVMWNTWYTFKMVFQGNRIMCYFGDILVFDVTDTTYQNGCVGLINAGGHTYFDDVQVLSYPPDPKELTQMLIETIETWNLPKGTENSLASKLKNAIQSLDNGQQNAAINKLNAFINEVQAQRNKKLTSAQADTLITEAQKIINTIQG